jgi:hypothetical protein
MIFLSGPKYSGEFEGQRPSFQQLTAARQGRAASHIKSGARPMRLARRPTVNPCTMIEKITTI